MSPTPTYEPAPQRSGLLIALVAGAIIALVGANVYLYLQIDKMRTDMATMKDKMNAEFSTLRDTSSVNTASQMRRIETLKQELEDARLQSRSLSSQAKLENAARVEQLTKQVASEQAKLQQQMTKEITGVRETAEAANTRIAETNTEVGSVKTAVASTTAELQKTIADLKSVRGDLGVQSGLIATNGTELAALRRLGERNYFEFKLGKTKQRQRVGDITLLLKKTDPKKNKYTVEVMADDKLTEKKDKNVNEPVQFYTSKARQPYELVVNQVQKDLIVGYLATPKEQANR